MRARAALATLILIASVVLVPAAPASARAADPSKVRCANVGYAKPLADDKGPSGAPVKTSLDPRGKFVPVVMVHGWTSQSTHNAERTGTFSHKIDLTDIAGTSVTATRSLIGQLQLIPGAAVYTFDYHEHSARWVDDSHLGPALGAAIDCLYAAGGEKVIVVGHSMGGLVARWAISRSTAAGRPRATEVSTLVTFGTPVRGSIFAGLFAGGLDAASAADPRFAVLRAILAACGGQSSGKLTTGSLCDLLPAFVRAFDSDAGRALRAGSAELRALPKLPSSVHLTALAGDTRLNVASLGWFGLTPWGTASLPVGDVIVDRSSALGAAKDAYDAGCSYQLDAVRGARDLVGLTLKQIAQGDVAQPIWSLAGPCFHTNLMRTIKLTNVATGVVNDDITARSYVDLRKVDRAEATIPGELCKSPGPIKLHDGSATNVPSSFGGPTPNYPQDVGAFVDDIAYGDLTGDGRPEAALPVLCANHDSTAAGQNAYGILVFTGAGGKPKLIGTAVGMQPRLGEPPNLLKVKKIGKGRLTVEETFYGSVDANCCPSGLATDVWRWADGRLTPLTSTIITPATSG